MFTHDMILAFIGSGIFISLLGMFFRMGKHVKEMQIRFEWIENAIKATNDKIDREVGLLRADMHREITSLRGEIASLRDELHKEVDELKAQMREIRSDIKEIRKDLSSLNREVGVITATLKFNGFDLDRHKAEGE